MLPPFVERGKQDRELFLLGLLSLSQKYLLATYGTYGILPEMFLRITTPAPINEQIDFF
jgi:hypothetical protein